MSLEMLSGCVRLGTPPILTPPAKTETNFETPSEAVLAQEGYFNPEIPRITVEELYTLTQTGTNLLIIDTRSESLYKADHIPGATNIPYSSLGGELDMTTRASLLNLEDTHLKIFYCDCPHDDISAMFAKELISNGYNKGNIKVLWKGYFRWEELGYPVTRN